MQTFTILKTIILVNIVVVSTIFGQSRPDIKISFDRKECSITVDSGATAASISFRLIDTQRGDRAVMLGSKRLISGDSLIIGGRSISLAAMSVRSVTQREGFYDVVLTDASSSQQSRRGRTVADKYGSFEKLRLSSEEFVRGSVLAVGGDIESEAEVNGFVVALFGDISLGATATCHRDVIAVGGKIRRDIKARIYGAIQSTEEWKRSDIFRRRRRNYGHQPIEWSKEWSYNRADGLTLGAGVAFRSEDNFVPRFFAQVGYGASSEIWKYRLGFDHKLFDYHQLTFGASVYRQTKTQDEWICGSGENTVYALIRREDFRDYFQGEGATFFLEQHINSRHTLRAEYFVEELDSLPAHPRLWSLVGGSKDFRSSFSALPESQRSSALKLYSGDEAALGLSYRFQTVVDPERSAPQGWWLAFQYEHSSNAIASDFNYDRYTLEARRYQRLNDLLNLNVRAIYGELTGKVPPHRLYYLGGIRTLRGHEIKEYSGTQMALVNVEYVFNPDRTILDFAALFDIGGVGNGERSLSGSQWHGDVGVAVIIGELIRIELTRRFNGDSDELQPSVLIGRSF